MFSRQSGKTSRPELWVDDIVEPTSSNEQSVTSAPSGQRSRILAQIRDHDWAIGLFYATCDIFCWVLLYGLVGYLRRDAFFVSPFEFVLVDCITVAVILQALYIIGGYNRNTETRALTYTADHILAIAAAAAISSLVIYSAAAYDVTMKPSRGVLLISFVMFLPISLVYRRFFRRGIAASAAQRAFLVIGSGELARRFYEAYRQSPNQQRLEFVDNDDTRVGSTIAGEGLPVIQGDIAAKLAQLDRTYSGVILADGVDRRCPQLLERLVRPQFQRARVYTRENDSRVTRLGRWLRKLRIDELPQLWNVFKGDISLIGPRAEWIKCVERYEKKIPFYHFRHLVKPGITGWAQVNYPYGDSEEDAVAKLQYDLYYIRHYSLKLDAMIVLKTVHTMLFGKGR